MYITSVNAKIEIITAIISMMLAKDLIKANDFIRIKKVANQHNGVRISHLVKKRENAPRMSKIPKMNATMLFGFQICF